MDKKIMSAVLAGAMAFSMAVPAFADDTTTISGTVTNNTNNYVLVIPAGNTNLSLNDTDSAQSIGNLKVTRTVADKAAGLPFNTAKKVTVTVTSANSGKLANTTEGVTDTIAYTLGMGDKSVTSWTPAPTQDFSATNINDETAVAMTTTITGDATAVENGTYQDVLTFSASLADAVTTTYAVTLIGNGIVIDAFYADEGTAWSVSGGDEYGGYGYTLTIGDKSYGTDEVGSEFYYWVLGGTRLVDDDSGTITEKTIFYAVIVAS